MLSPLLISILCAVVLCDKIGTTPAARPQVSIGATTILGTRGPSHIEFFGGIPFAKPPVGNLRFAPPELATTLNHTLLDASNWGPACPQPVPFLYPDLAQSEDCLKLNIIRPTNTGGDIGKLPVLVWIYGGGFLSGWPGDYNGTEIVARSVLRKTPLIYINVGYRLGAFGFPDGTEAVAKGALNLGLKDQIAALQWIQANVEYFGGDKSKVTIFGESAGAASIQLLYFNSQLEQLVRGAILQSAPDVIGRAGVLGPRESSDLRWKVFAARVPGCNASTEDTFACLRQATWQQIVKAAEDPTALVSPFLPVLDGPGGLIPDLPSKLLDQGKFAKVPFIAGTNLDEGTLFVPNSLNSTQDFMELLTLWTSGLQNDTVARNVTISKLLELYPDDPALGCPFGTGNETFGRSAAWKRAAALASDIFMNADRRWLSNAAAKAGLNSYGYLFSDPQPSDGLLPGVAHAAEITYIYGGLWSNPIGPPGAGFKALSPIIMDYWISFAASGNPNDGNGENRPEWHGFTPSSKVLMELNSQKLEMVPDKFREEQIAFITANPHAFVN